MAQKKNTRQTYQDRLDAIKAEYKRRTGKRPYGDSFKKKAPDLYAEAQKVKKNLKDFRLREKKRKTKDKTKEPAKLLAEQQAPEPEALETVLPDSIIQVIAFDEPFHLVLSYGGKVERAIEDALNEGERLGFKVEVRIEHFNWGAPRFYVSRLAVTIAFQQIYMDCLKMQQSTGSSVAVLIRAFSQDQGGVRIVTVQTYPESKILKI